jgi:HlyD family secretion protein
MAPLPPDLPAYDSQDRVLARKPVWRRYALVAAGVLALAGGGAWLIRSPGTSASYRLPLNQVTIGTVREGPFEDYIAVRAAVAPYVTAYLTTEQGGTVKQVLVEDGATVRAGQAMIVLSNPALQLQVASQQLAFEQTRLKYEQDLLDIDHKLSTLKSNLERDKILLDGNALAPSAYQQEQEDYAYYARLRDATVASRQVEQNVRATQLTGDTSGTSDLASAGIEALTIRAPMDGQLTALDAEVGQSKAQGSILGQVNSADRFKLTAQVDQYYLGRVTEGQEARFTVDGRDYRAHVAKVYPQVVNDTFKADFYFDDAPPAGVHIGQSIDMKIELGGAAKAMMLPNGPFYQDTGGNWVFVVTPDGSAAVRRSVHLGRTSPDNVEIVDGLQPGERVITSGYEGYSKFDRVLLTKNASTH